MIQKEVADHISAEPNNKLMVLYQLLAVLYDR